MNDDDNIFKRSPPDTIRFMSKEENPYINRADIIPDMSTFGISRPGAGIGGIPNHDSLIGSGPEPEYPGEYDDAVYDFGASRAEFRPEAGDARDRGDLHAGIADAVGQLHGFTNDLIQDDVFETYPNRLAAETRSIRHEIGGRIADGQKRDLFDNALELMSQNAATEIRSVATERMVARNRAGLNKALDIYAGLIARSGNPVTTDFAGNQGLNAIDAQIQDGIINEAEGARLRAGFLTDIDDRSAVSLIQDDPDAALAELSNPVAYPNLAPARLAELLAQANMRKEAARLDAKLAQAQVERKALQQQSRAADGFETQYRTALGDGTATLAQISDGALAGTITPDRAARLSKAHETAQAKLTEDHRLAGIVWDALETGSPLNSDDLDHIRAADGYFFGEIMPGLIAARTQEEIAPFRDRIAGLGVAPPAMVQRLGLWWRSGNAELAEKAARMTVNTDPGLVQDMGPFTGFRVLPKRPDDDPSRFRPLPIRPGMAEFIELLEGGVDPEEALPVAMKMVEEDRNNPFGSMLNEVVISGAANLDNERRSQYDMMISQGVSPAEAFRRVTQQIAGGGKIPVDPYNPS